MLNIERGTILRAYFSLQALTIWFLGMYEPLSMHYHVTQSEGTFGATVISVMGLLGMVSLLDVVINDIMPKRFKFSLGLCHRHLILMTLALFHAAELFVALHRISSIGLAVFCLINVVFITITAFRDIQLRYKRDAT